MMLSSIFPRKNQRMTCVDDYLVDAGEVSFQNVEFKNMNKYVQGWARLEAYVKKLGSMGYLTAVEEIDLERRLKLSRSFLEGTILLLAYSNSTSYRSHSSLLSFSCRNYQ